jgi:hypothetical protein
MKIRKIALALVLSFTLSAVPALAHITTGTVTAAQLNFTPATSTNVIATINASAEGLAITADRISISGSTTHPVAASASDGLRWRCRFRAVTAMSVRALP